jgi:murein DD-endopeptidase MepM/ murein hydrolase activator NlpD
VISLRDRLVEDQAARRREAAQRPPVIFFVGVVMMTSVLGVLMLQAVTHGGSAAAAAGSADPTSMALAATAARTHSPTPAPTVAPYLGLTGYVWPLEKPVITLPFGPSDWGDFFDNGARIHDGVDIASNCGDNVLAAHDGVVLAAGRQYDDYMGWIGSVTPYYNLLTTKKWWNSLPIVVIIDDGDGYRSIYAHEEQLFVTVGQRVKAGDRIGLEGATGNASGCHVHFGLFSPM